MKWRGGLVITVWEVWEETVGSLRHKNLCKNLTGAFSVYSTILTFLNFSITLHHFFRKKKRTSLSASAVCPANRTRICGWVSAQTSHLGESAYIHWWRDDFGRSAWTTEINTWNEMQNCKGRNPSEWTNRWVTKKKKSILTFGIATPGVLLLFFILKNDALPLYALRLQKGGTPPFASPV